MNFDVPRRSQRIQFSNSKNQISKMSVGTVAFATETTNVLPSFSTILYLAILICQTNYYLGIAMVDWNLNNLNIISNKNDRTT